MSDLRPGPIVVSGFFQDTRGVSEAARLAVSALRRAGFAVIEHDVSYLVMPKVREPRRLEPAGGVWIVHCNAPEGVHVLDRHRDLSTAPMFRIGAWAWELPEAPSSWLKTSDLFHELWAPSAFTAQAFRGATSPVRVMPHPVVRADPPAETRLEGQVRFLVIADLRSASSRKNPQGALAAYAAAFPTPGTSRLTIKLSGLEADRSAADALIAMCRDRPDVQVLTGPLDPGAMLKLLDQAHVLVSLHRAEGFGLTLAEAMAAQRCVLATGWSGNMEFMDGLPDGQCVAFSMTPVVDRTGHYTEDQHWAEPDIADAAAKMRRLAADPALRARLGSANSAQIAALGRHWTRARLSESAFAPWAEFSAGPESAP